MNGIAVTGWFAAGWFAVSTASAFAAEGVGRLYELPEAGSYDLPVIDRVERHERPWDGTTYKNGLLILAWLVASPLPDVRNSLVARAIQHEPQPALAAVLEDQDNPAREIRVAQMP